MRHRRRRRGRRAAYAGLVALALAVLALPFRWPGQSPVQAVEPGPRATLRPASQPTARTEPHYLQRSYRAPPDLVRAGAGGTLRVPSLGITAPVDAVGLDGSAMAVPDDPRRVGWLTRSAKAGDVMGASVLAGHVSDPNDRPGALARLHRVRLGVAVTWTVAGRVERFRVAQVQLFPRTEGLPASIFATDGPRVLHLVTCADRVANGSGFHYRANLVVTAVR